MNKKNFFAALVAALFFFNVILSANVLAYGGPKLDKEGYYTLTEYSYGNGDYSIVYKEYDLVRLVKQANGTYKYYKYDETVRLKTLSLDRGSSLNSRNNKPKKIIIPEGVEAIMDGSFENKGLTDVKFPNSLQYIGSSAFRGNEISGKISLPNVWKVDSFAFEGNKITGIDAPKLELIDTNAFENNMIEGEVNLPELKAISWNGLANNKEITLITPKLEVVGRDAFLNTKVTKAELPKLKLVEGQGRADNIKKYYTTKEFTVEWKAEGEAKLPEQKPVVKVHLYANGEQKENYVIVSNGAKTAVFKDLPSYYIDQTPFNYTAKEAFNDLIIQDGETFVYELEGVKYTFKVNYEGDKIINTVVKSEDPKQPETPADPKQPETPADPKQPERPADPKQPEKPVVPSEPKLPDYSGGRYYEPTPSDNYWKKPIVEAKAEPKKEVKKEEKAEAKKEVKSEPVVITSKFTLDSMNFRVNDSINTMDVAPFAKNGRIMVPIRFVGMALGFDVSWDDATKTAILKDDKTEIRIPINGKTFYVNGVAFEADAEPEIRSERIFLSISNIAKALGLQEGTDIIWEQETKTATIIFKK